ncbi:Conjugative transfer protein TrbI (plasmid) [Acidisarcina polymorpha]|uniref:Conjugative transfer protein TrbI n=1 Tax=Acidisarcina polymorpha TaxID=2211140 RepID=A0A2Z5GAS6_9BACT|nr:TrbI/VirB10 family protein [Acidisarcina polymorpha]AXC15977.1 Conjugative transfer protein TrbI [Acidisarcina polymorpha]
MDTVPQQPVAKPPIQKTLPIVLVLLGGVLLIGISTVFNLIAGHKKEAAKSTMQTKPSTADPQQVSGFEKQQEQIAKNDQDNLQMQKALAALRAQDQGAPGPEADPSLPMTPAQSAAIYGASPNAPRQTSGQAELEAQARQQAAERAKKREDALNSDTVAIDFAIRETPEAASAVSVHDENKAGEDKGSGPPAQAAGDSDAEKDIAEEQGPRLGDKKDKNPMAAYDFDAYGGQLYRIFEGTVLEGVVTNHTDGGMAGPVLIMLTTDYYSHDHRQLLLPQGTRLIGSVQTVGSQQQHKLAVVFHRAVCPDGFSIDLDKYPGLDPLGTTGLATKVDHGYAMTFAAAAAVGGLGGLAQIGNAGSSLTTSSQIRNGLSSQTSAEGEQILDHFLNRLPIITLKEGSRARVYIGKDILIPSYANHRVNPNL